MRTTRTVATMRDLQDRPEALAPPDASNSFFIMNFPSLALPDRT